MNSNFLSDPSPAQFHCQHSRVSVQWMDDLQHTWFCLQILVHLQKGHSESEPKQVNYSGPGLTAPLMCHFIWPSPDLQKRQTLELHLSSVQIIRPGFSAVGGKVCVSVKHPQFKCINVKITWSAHDTEIRATHVTSEPQNQISWIYQNSHWCHRFVVQSSESNFTSISALPILFFLSYLFFLPFCLFLWVFNDKLTKLKPRESHILNAYHFII